MRPLTLAVVVVLSATACASTPRTENAVEKTSGRPPIAARELAHLGLPVYPNASVDEAFGHLAGGTKGRVARFAALRTRDALEKVAAWYGKHLSADYASSRVTYGDAPLTTFALAEGGAERAVVLKAARDERGETVTAITLMADSSR